MRQLIVFLLLSWSVSPALLGQSIRVVTWEIDGFESASQALGPSETEIKRLRQVAANLKPIEADIIVLQGLSDPQFARGLASFLGPTLYQVALYSNFRRSGTSNGTGPSIAILSKRPPIVARSMEWRATGQIDQPGGFAFANFNAGTSTLCLYAAHLPIDSVGISNESPGQTAIRRRELAAQYLVHHAKWLTGTLSNQAVSIVLVGNFEANSRSDSPDAAVRVLQQAGFKGGSTTLSASVQPKDSVRSGLLTRNTDYISLPQLLTRKPFKNPITTFELGAKAPALSKMMAGGSNRSSAGIIHWSQTEFWLWSGGLGVLLTTVFLVVWLVWRRESKPRVFRRREQGSMVLDLSGFSGPGGSAGFSGPGEENLTDATANSGHAGAAVWQARALQAEERASQAIVAARTGLTPHLGRLLKHRLIAWLSSQRSQLLTSHEVGTQQVLELEERLVKIQGDFQERLRSREERITNLEQEILVKEKTIRDLLRAQVRMANEASDE